MAEITDSWEQIGQAVAEGFHTTRYQLGDTKTFTHETYGEVVMQIVAFDADDKADGSGKAAISWVSRDIITTHVMNSTNTSVGGWEASEMRAWLQTDVYDALPDDVKAAIAKVEKTYYVCSPLVVTEICNDTVWIPSYREMFGRASRETSGAKYTDYFDSDTARTKHNSSGFDAFWWLRSARVSSKGFELVGSDGALFDGYTGSNSATETYGVVLGFCTDASNTASTPIDPASLLMGYRVGQMIRGMRKQQKENV